MLGVVQLIRIGIDTVVSCAGGPSSHAVAHSLTENS